MNTHNNDSLFRLDGKTALVTGAGAGIGRGIAETFANAGASVIVVDIDQARADETAHAIVARGAKASALVADISREADVVALFEHAPAVYGGLDILVNNAAIFPKKPFMEVDTEFWDRLHGVNLRGTFLCLREGIRRMREQGRGGSIVNISSVSSLQTAVYHNATYNASKAGVNSLTRTTALEFAADGIRVNAVLPGGVLTPGAKAATSTIEIKGPMTTPGRIPLGGMGDAADIAAAALFLAGPAARYITGQLLAVDGGFQIG
ncbi:glucose 1-dehydrogenase [uncultured Herbaspirillum sp.]|uniref:SDR family NAD(P)-dependent oxidoreductase n=1 Tax=uncultured Herbaspirillum sp. TaxID=160236 RepID=UPI002586689F|nr:glucose 1-dehydrogenase [uncultured Herbaspirillum sp.]